MPRRKKASMHEKDGRIWGAASWHESLVRCHGGEREREALGRKRVCINFYMFRLHGVTIDRQKSFLIQTGIGT